MFALFSCPSKLSSPGSCNDTVSSAIKKRNKYFLLLKLRPDCNALLIDFDRFGIRYYLDMVFKNYKHLILDNLPYLYHLNYYTPYTVN